LILATALLLTAGPAAADPGADVDALVRQVDRTELQGPLEILSGARSVDLGTGSATIRSRCLTHPDLPLATQYLEELLTSRGFEVRRFPFEAPSAPGAAPENLQASLPGEDDTAGILILGAHLDSIATRDDEFDCASDPAPGADDDGSGCAVLLEAARVLGQARFRSTIRLVFFSGEEQGLLGSAAYAQQAKARGDDIRMMASLDPVGNAAGILQDNLLVIYSGDSKADAAALSDVGTRFRFGYALQVVDNAAIDDTASDHQSFWTQGYRALHVLTLPGDVYHTANDTAAGVDVEFATQVTEMMVATVGEAGGYLGPRTPAGCGCRTGDAGDPLWPLALLTCLFCLVLRRARPPAQKEN
jgi:hypothetical protein